MYPLEANVMSEFNARANDHSKSMFNPVKDTSLHRALTNDNWTQALTVTRTNYLPGGSFWYDKTKCPAFYRMIVER